jgi:hypothetical protein
MITLKLERFVVSVNRNRRSAVPVDWIDQIRQIRGVEVVGQPTSQRRVLITASDGGVLGIKERFGDLLHVERLVLHQLAS